MWWQYAGTIFCAWLFWLLWTGDLVRINKWWAPGVFFNAYDALCDLSHISEAEDLDDIILAAIMIIAFVFCVFFSFLLFRSNPPWYISWSTSAILLIFFSRTFLRFDRVET